MRVERFERGTHWLPTAIPRRAGERRVATGVAVFGFPLLSLFLLELHELLALPERPLAAPPAPVACVARRVTREVIGGGYLGFELSGVRVALFFGEEFDHRVDLF